LREVMVCVFEELRKVVKSAADELESSRTPIDQLDQAINSSKKLNILAKGLQYLYDCVASSEPKQQLQLSSRRKLYPSDDEILEAFKKRIDFEPLLHSLELSKAELSNLQFDQSVRLWFFARLARNLKRLLETSNPDRPNVADLIIKSGSVPEQAIDQSKFGPLKKATEETFEKVRNRITEIKSELFSCTITKQVVYLAKVSRNVARVHSESRGEPLSFLFN